MTRSIDNANTSGFIADDALHWAIESYIPVETSDLKRYLVSRDELDAEPKKRFLELCRHFEKVVHEQTGAYHTEFSSLYTDFDPDFDGRLPMGIESENTQSHIDELMSLSDQILQDAGYRELEQAEIENCVGVASQWGVPLHVNFDVFEQLAVYARGDVVGTRYRRRLRRLYQPEEVDVPIYQRIVVIFRLVEDEPSEEELRASVLHMRMFKNIPKQDVDMLLPGTRVRLSKIDRAKIIVPSLGGLVLSLRKIFQFVLIFAALTLYSTFVLVGLILAAIGYVVKSVLSYFRTKDRYLLSLTRNLYFQKLDTNAGVAYRMIQQSQRQCSIECAVTLFSILANDDPISRRKLRRRCERILRESIDVEIDFQIDRALDRLSKAGLVQSNEDLWRPTDPE